MSGPRSAAAQSFRSGQVGAGLVAGTATLFASCAYLGGGWRIIQWVALVVVVVAVAMIVFLGRLIREAEAGYAEQPRPPIVARPAPAAAAPPPRLTPGPDHRTGRPADTARKAAL